MSPAASCVGTFVTNFGIRTTTTLECRPPLPLAFFLHCWDAAAHSPLGSNVGIGLFLEVDDGNSWLSASDSDFFSFLRVSEPLLTFSDALSTYINCVPNDCNREVIPLICKYTKYIWHNNYTISNTFLIACCLGGHLKHTTYMAHKACLWGGVILQSAPSRQQTHCFDSDTYIKVQLVLHLLHQHFCCLPVKHAAIFCTVVCRSVVHQRQSIGNGSQVFN